ncbi:unnamed protein product, partial [Allacma fusca]
MPLSHWVANMSPVLVILLFCSIILPITQCQRSSFGETCGKDHRCDRRAWLGCFNEKCDCLKPEEMIYEPNSKKCVSKAGERCKFKMENYDGNTALEITSCVENSRCGSDGFCSCKEDFQEITNGTCIPSRKFGEPCDPQFKCSSRQGLDCEDSICGCSPSQVFSQVQGHCVGLVGQDCVKSKCSENAMCDLRINKCGCVNGYFQDWEDKCSPKLGLFKNCSRDDQCWDKSPLKCIEGECTCNPDVSLLYRGEKVDDNYPNAVCAGRVNSPCISSRCAAGSTCHADYVIDEATIQVHTKPRNFESRKITPRDGISWWKTRAGGDDYGFHSGSSEEAEVPLHGFFPGHTIVHARVPALTHVCHCKDGFTPSKSGTCGKPYGATCTKGECVEGLVCKGNFCSCQYSHQEFCTLTLSCRNKIRGPCTANEDCIETSNCHLYNNHTFGECKCKDGYIENLKRECDVEHGGDCVRNSDCDSVAGLVCTEGNCKCRGFAKFSEDNRKCLSLVGGDCHTSSTGNSSCIENAHCAIIGKETLANGNPGTCVCNDGFSISPEYTCNEQKTERWVRQQRTRLAEKNGENLVESDGEEEMLEMAELASQLEGAEEEEMLAMAEQASQVERGVGAGVHDLMEEEEEESSPLEVAAVAGASRGSAVKEDPFADLHTCAVLDPE